MNAYEFIVRMKDYASSQIKNVASSVGVASRKAKDFVKDLGGIERESSRVSGGLGKLKSALVGVFAFAAVQSFVGKVVEARAEFEKFDAVLTNTFQSKEIGSGALAMLTEFAAKTPYQLNELTGGFIKLVNRGIYPTVDEMTKMGDLASSQGKSFDQLVEAIMDAQTGEFERMKEFGIKASKNGDMVKLSFKGVTKEVANNEQAIKDAIIAYGAMDGVAGSMEVVSKTLGGQLSNLEDQWWGFLVAVGGYGGGIFGEALGGAADILQILQDNLPYIAHWFDLLWQIVSPLGDAIKTFITQTLGISSASDVMQGFANVMTGVLLVVNWLVTGALSPLGKAILGIVGAYWLWNSALAVFNALMAVNPITWIIVGIVALIGLIGLAINYVDGWGKSWEGFKQIFFSVYGGIINIAKIAINYLFSAWGKFKDWFIGIWKTISGVLAGAFAPLIVAAKFAIEKILQFFGGTGGKLAKIFGIDVEGIKQGLSKISLKVDKDSASKDFKKLKDSFGGVKGAEKGNANDYLSSIPGLRGAGKKDDATAGADGKKGKQKGDGITSGGNKMTTITVNINKLQDQTVINVDKTETGINNLGEKVQEILLRAVNSVNQMQTN